MIGHEPSFCGRLMQTTVTNASSKEMDLILLSALFGCPSLLAGCLGKSKQPEEDDSYQRPEISGLRATLPQVQGFKSDLVRRLRKWRGQIRKMVRTLGLSQRSPVLGASRNPSSTNNVERLHQKSSNVKGFSYRQCIDSFLNGSPPPEDDKCTQEWFEQHANSPALKGIKIKKVLGVGSFGVVLHVAGANGEKRALKVVTELEKDANIALVPDTRCVEDENGKPLCITNDGIRWYAITMPILQKPKDQYEQFLESWDSLEQSLRTLHGKKQTHRDLSFDNVMMYKGKMIAFDASGSRNEDFGLVGSGYYMDFLQLKEDKYLPANDMWSLQIMGLESLLSVYSHRFKHSFKDLALKEIDCSELKDCLKKKYHKNLNDLTKDNFGNVADVFVMYLTDPDLDLTVTVHCGKAFYCYLKAILRIFQENIAKDLGSTKIIDRIKQLEAETTKRLELFRRWRPCSEEQ